MNRKNLTKIMKGMGFQKIKSKGTWIHASCPFAQWRHQKGRDRRPSFGIKVSVDGPSGYKCFGCDSHGTLFSLIGELSELYGADFSGWEEFCWRNEGDEISGSFEAASGDTLKTPEQKELVVYPESEYLPFFARIPEYAFTRGFDVDVIKAWELGDAVDEGRMTIPIRRYEDNALVGVRGRSYTKREPKYFPLLPFIPSNYLYGEHMIRPAEEEPRIGLVEGELDVMRVWQAGFTGLGMFGGHLSDVQRTKLELFCHERPLVLIPDNDKTGRRWANRVGDYFKNLTQVYDVQLPKDAKDAADLVPERLSELICKAPMRL